MSEMNKEKVKEFVATALEEAIRNSPKKVKDKCKELKKKKKKLSDGTKNSIRSRCFVKCLRDHFETSSYIEDLRKQYSDDYLIKVVSATKPREFLHDISISKEVRVLSPKDRKTARIFRIEEVLWQIESEMSEKARDVMDDLNKLGAGTMNSKKLFIVQLFWLQDNCCRNWLRDRVNEIAVNQKGSFYLAFIPHPCEWIEVNMRNIEEYVTVCQCC